MTSLGIVPLFKRMSFKARCCLWDIINSCPLKHVCALQVKLQRLTKSPAWHKILLPLLHFKNRKTFLHLTEEHCKTSKKTVRQCILLWRATSFELPAFVKCNQFGIPCVAKGFTTKLAINLINNPIHGSENVSSELQMFCFVHPCRP